MAGTVNITIEGASSANGYFLTTTNGITSSTNKASSKEGFLVRTHYS